MLHEFLFGFGGSEPEVIPPGGKEFGMDVKEKEMIETLRQQDKGFSRLVDEHSRLDREISELESKNFLTTDEELEIKRLKKLKLAVKDEMTQILKRHDA